jgi:hypothetical protein
MKKAAKSMFSLRVPFKTFTNVLAALLLFAAMAAAQIPGLCNTGQTKATASGCTGILVTPNPNGGGPNRDGNWQLAYPYPSDLSRTHGPCELAHFVKTWVDTPEVNWLPNSVSTASEWTTPYDGEGNQPQGWYVYRTAFPVPLILSDGSVPTGLTINGQLASDNTTFAIYLESPAHSGRCSLVSGQPFPVNPDNSFQQWWPFNFSNSDPITPGADAYLYFVVQNAPSNGYPNATGLRVEFFPTSMFN